MSQPAMWKFVGPHARVLDPTVKAPSNAPLIPLSDKGTARMDPKHSDALLSRYLGDTLEQGSVRMIGAIAVLALVISVIVYIA